MLIDLLVDVAELIEIELPEAVKVSVTPGTPPAPASDCVPQAHVWGNAIYHSDLPNVRGSDDAGCFYRRTYDMSYRIDICYPVQADDLTTAQLLAVSSDLYNYSDTVWCAITAAASGGTLFQSISDCDAITVGELVFSEPLGGIVSATGTIQVSQPCAPEGS